MEAGSASTRACRASASHLVGVSGGGCKAVTVQWLEEKGATLGLVEKTTRDAEL